MRESSTTMAPTTDTQQQQQQPEQKQTTLDFYQAMSDFKNMFPQMDDDVIEAVLRANQGAVDTTIDQLLSMNTDNENEKIRSEMEDNDLSGSSTSTSKNETFTIKKIQHWTFISLPLPPNFLKIIQTGPDHPDLEGSLDERIAMFLQNEEFMAELRWNEDFLSTLEKDSKLQGKCDSSTDEDLFKERLKNMGKASRRKFAQLTKVFTRSKKRNGRQLLPPAASCDDLLGSDEKSHA